MLPGAAAYTYLGYAGGEAFAGPENLIKHGRLVPGESSPFELDQTARTLVP